MSQDAAAVSLRNLQDLLEHQSVTHFQDAADVLRRFIESDTLLSILSNNGETRVLVVSNVFEATSSLIDDPRELCAVVITAFSIATGKPIGGFDDISPNLKVAASKLAR